jgi:hypothetical protein
MKLLFAGRILCRGPGYVWHQTGISCSHISVLVFTAIKISGVNVFADKINAAGATHSKQGKLPCPGFGKLDVVHPVLVFGHGIGANVKAQRLTDLRKRIPVANEVRSAVLFLLKGPSSIASSPLKRFNCSVRS